MTKVAQDFEFWTGEDKSLVYTVTGSDGASMNLTDYSASWLLQDEPESGSLLRYVSTDSEVTVSGCTVTVAIPASDTSGCSLSGTYYTELSACDTSNLISVLAVGTATIHRRGY